MTRALTGARAAAIQQTAGEQTMKPLISTILGSHLSKRLDGITGTNPLVKFGAASLATRLIASSVPLGLLVVGGLAFWDHKRNNDAGRKAFKNKAATVRDKVRTATTASEPATA
jgi:hypothetical protein